MSFRFDLNIMHMLKAVVFDFDGTLTRPFLNFQQIRVEAGLSFSRQSLLEQMESVSGPERARAMRVLETHEERAAENAELNRGVVELLQEVKRRGLLSAIVTRNSEKSTALVISRLGLEVDRVITRDSGIALKPDPEALLFLSREWRIEPGAVLMVGDFRYDVMCGRSAGAWTCLVTNGGEFKDDCRPHFIAAWPGEVVRVLGEIDDGPGAMDLECREV